MLPEPILTPREIANPIRRCPCCEDLCYENEVLWLRCESCHQDVCAQCAKYQGEKVLCAECALEFICDRCGEMAPRLVETFFLEEGAECSAMLCSECLR